MVWPVWLELDVDVWICLEKCFFWVWPAAHNFATSLGDERMKLYLKWNFHLFTQGFLTVMHTISALRQWGGGVVCWSPTNSGFGRPENKWDQERSHHVSPKLMDQAWCTNKLLTRPPQNVARNPKSLTICRRQETLNWKEPLQPLNSLRLILESLHYIYVTMCNNM